MNYLFDEPTTRYVLLAICLLVAGDAIMFYLLFLKPYKNLLKLKGREASYTKGAVVDVKDFSGGRGGSGTYTQVSYKFDVSGQEILLKVTKPVSYNEKIAVGDTINVVYSKSNPKIASPEIFLDCSIKDKKRLLPIIGFAMVSAIFMFLFIILFGGNFNK